MHNQNAPQPNLLPHVSLAIKQLDLKEEESNQQYNNFVRTNESLTFLDVGTNFLSDELNAGEMYVRNQFL